MMDFSKFKLTDEDIKIGIEDFFSQLLVEARRKKNSARSIEDLSSDNPRISYIVGQPGAGKTTLSKTIQQEYEDREECVVELGSDKIATYHRDYAKLLRLLPEECYSISRDFVVPAEKIISERLKSNRINIVRETSLSKGEKTFQKIQKFKDSGYNVEINIIAVDKYESFLSCIERDTKLLELGYDPRPVARSNHDKMYDAFVQALIEIQRRGIADKINVFKRGKAMNQVELVYTTGDNKYATAQEAVMYERGLNRKQILADPQKYLNRIKESQQKIKLMIQDEKMKSNYLNELKQLEIEFLQELVYERRYE